eukprot:4497618-Heterocapsa_arctica.AAC.1
MSLVPIDSSERGAAASGGIGRQPSGSEIGQRSHQGDAVETLPSAAMTQCCWFCAEDEDVVGKLTDIATAMASAMPLPPLRSRT